MNALVNPEKLIFNINCTQFNCVIQFDHAIANRTPQN